MTDIVLEGMLEPSSDDPYNPARVTEFDVAPFTGFGNCACLSPLSAEIEVDALNARRAGMVEFTAPGIEGCSVVVRQDAARYVERGQARGVGAAGLDPGKRYFGVVGDVISVYAEWQIVPESFPYPRENRVDVYSLQTDGGLELMQTFSSRDNRGADGHQAPANRDAREFVMGAVRTCVTA